MATREMSIISHLHSNTIGGFRKLTFWLTESSSCTYLLTLSNTRLVLLIMAEPFMEFPVSDEYFPMSIFGQVFSEKYFWTSIFGWVFSDEYFPPSFFLMSFFVWDFFLSSFSVEFFPTSFFQRAFPLSFFLTNIFRRVFSYEYSQQVFWPVFSTKFFLNEFFNILFFTSHWQYFE